MKGTNSAKLAVMGAASLLAGGWLGLQARPRPFPRPPVSGDTPLERRPLPQGLPEAVARHYRLAFGEQAPVVKTAALLGRARFRMGLWLWMRFGAYHVPGQQFVREMDVTWFSIPILRGRDSYIGGRGVMQIRGETVGGAEIDQGESMVMWAEALMFPSALEAGGAHWQPVDAHTARLVMPLGADLDVATVRFDPVTGYMRQFSGWRYKGAGQSKVMWHVHYLNWLTRGAVRVPARITVTWEDEGSPWFIADVDELILNADVSRWLPAAS